MELVNPFNFEASDAVSASTVIDVFAANKSGNLPETASDYRSDMENLKAGRVADWLALAADPYQISPNLSDYVISAVPIVPSDIPNRNAVAFPLEELTKFIPDQGRISYKTWAGKPTFVEHKHDDFSKAKGVIFDTKLMKVSGMVYDNLWKVVALCGIDRTKDPELVAQILAGNAGSWSMGSMVSVYECSICGALGNNRVRKPTCGHLPMQGFSLHGSKIGERPKLAYSIARNIVGFETSVVKSPAWNSAVNPNSIYIPEY